MKINNTNVTLGVNFGTDYNLSEVYRNNKNPAVLPPVEWFNGWVKTETGTKYLDDLSTIGADKLLRALNALHPVIYVRSRYIWLQYLRHCIGNLDNAIAAEYGGDSNANHSK